ncbi:MAG: phosphomethylpyrimidine kinase [Deltaproteobacteria bacterium]|nr:phosphomethylpyrimidine kinase [Deltaproteobacteria bacterium]
MEDGRRELEVEKRRHNDKSIQPVPKNAIFLQNINRCPMKCVLTIAGFDPSSGAGISRDLDTFFSLGLHGIAAPTSIVVQGPYGVQDVYPMPYVAFQAMLSSMQEEMHVSGVKVGVLWNEQYVEALSAYLPEYPDIPVVVDPVLTAKNGAKLLSDKGLKSLIKLIFSKATVITPNLDEASCIIGHKVRTIKDMEGCARSLAATGPQAVVVKGGHLKGEPIDLLFDGSSCITWKRKRIDRVIHGTGCIFSSLLMSFLVHGYSIKEAFLASEGMMDNLVKECYQISKEGYFYTSSGLLNNMLAERWKVIQTMREAKERLCLLNLVDCIPEVQMNIGYALEEAKGIEDVAAFPGRIGHHEGKVCFKGDPQFGASSHVARLILNYMHYVPSMRSCANVRYHKAMIRRAREKGLTVLLFDSREKSSGARKKERQDLDTLMGKNIKYVDNPPDIIYDEGDIGKEPMIRLFARSPLELLKKMEMIAR